MEVILLLVLGFVSVIGVRHYLRQKRREALLEKYGDAAAVERIMQRQIWQGMSEEQLLESWGSPVAKDQRLYKTKVTETFKYNQTGKNRFGSRVKVENGVVVGWEQK